jgi:hypothetical protein
MKRTTTTDFNPTRGRRRTIKNPKDENQNPTTRKKRNKMIFKLGRDLQSISIAECCQSISIAEAA